MAQLSLSAAEKQRARDNRVYVGRDVEVTFITPATGAAAGDEWISSADHGLRFISKVVGAVVVGVNAAAPVTVACRKNSEGTDDAAADTNGALGIRTGGAAANGVEVTLRGKL